MLIANALICRKCNSIIYSTCRHDMRFCECKSIAIDGGFDYCQQTGNPDDYVEIRLPILKATKDELYKDYVFRNGRYGFIRLSELNKTIEEMRTFSKTLDTLSKV